MPLYTAITQDE